MKYIAAARGLLSSLDSGGRAGGALAAMMLKRRLRPGATGTASSSVVMTLDCVG